MPQSHAGRGHSHPRILLLVFVEFPDVSGRFGNNGSTVYVFRSASYIFFLSAAAEKRFDRVGKVEYVDFLGAPDFVGVESRACDA